MQNVNSEVAVVGGGIVGCATAYFLARRKVPVVLYEKERVGRAQSGQNWGFVRQQGRDPLEVPLMMESIRIWRGLREDLNADVGWVEGGNLGIASTPQKMAAFEGWVREAAAHGLESRILMPARVSELIPSMQGRWVGGMYTPTDGHAEPEKVAPAFAAAARRLGARIVEGCAVDAIELAGGAVSGLRTDIGFVRTKCVVAAGGAWTGKLMRGIGVSLPQRLVRSTVVRTNPHEPLTRIGVWASGVAFRQRPDGSFNLGGGGWSDHDITLESLRHAQMFLSGYWKNRKLFQFHFGRPLVRDFVGRLPGTYSYRHPFAHPAQDTPQANPAKRDKTLREFKALFPHLSGVRVQEAWAGYIDTTPDALPVIDTVAKVPGLVVAAGFSGHGFGMGPIAGRLVSELAVDGRPSMDLRGFHLSRFEDGTYGTPRSVM